MLKHFSLAIALTVLGFAAHAEATQCPMDAIEVETLIESQDSCESAAKVARDCGWGSGIDVQFAGAASAKCTANMNKWPSRHRQIRVQLQKDCSKKYASVSGSMYRSAEAYCYLNIDELLWSLNLSVDE